MPFRRDKRRNIQSEVVPVSEPEPEPTQETLIDVSPDSAQPNEPDLLVIYVRFLGVFFLMFIVGVLIGFGLTRGTHAVIITLSFIFSINGGILYFYGVLRLQDQILRCFNTEHDGYITREEWRKILTSSSMELFYCGICGCFIGILVGLLSF